MKLDDLDRIQRDFPATFPATPNCHYMNASSLGLVPQPTVTHLQELNRKFMEGTRSFEHWFEYILSSRGILARSIGAHPDEIAYTTNTTIGLNHAAKVIPFKRGDNLLVADTEYPGNVYPWLRVARERGVEIRFVKNVGGTLPSQQFIDLMDENTRAVAVSLVQFENGFRVDVPAISRAAHEFGAYLIADVIQGFGVLDLRLDKLGADFMATGSYKFGLGPVGAGFLAVRQEILPDLDEPAYVGLWSEGVDDVESRIKFRDAYELSPTARRFELGMVPVAELSGFAKSVQYLQDLGFQNLERASLKLTGTLIEELDALSEHGVEVLTPDAPEQRAATVLFRCPRQEQFLEQFQARYIVTARGGGIRVGMHPAYNTIEDVHGFVTDLAGFLE